MKGRSMTKMIRGLSLLGLSALTVTALSGCETSEDRSLASAQSCLDGAHDEASANQCIAMVQGLSTPDSYLIRCSANFIAQGFTGQKIADAFQTLANNGDENADPMVSLMGYLNFKNTNPVHSSTNTEENCKLSGVRSMLRLASAANLATTVQQIANSYINVADLNGDPVHDMQVAIEALNGASLTPTDAAPIGTVALTAHEAFCNPGSAYQGEEICNNLSDAITTTDGTPGAIGAILIGLLNNNPI